MATHIHISKKSKILSEEQMFVNIVYTLELCWGKSNKLYDLFKINILEYEEDYYQVIEGLIQLKYGLWKAEIILWYIFGRIDIDNKMHPLLMQNEGEEEKEVFLKTPSELWEFLIELEKKKLEVKNQLEFLQENIRIQKAICSDKETIFQISQTLYLEGKIRLVELEKIQTDLMEIKLFLKKSNKNDLKGKTTTDYFDYAVLKSNSKASKPIEELISRNY